MTTTGARNGIRSGFKERHKHESDIRTARIKDGTLRGELAQLEAEERQVDADLAAQDIEVARGVAGAEKRRGALRERKQQIEQAKADIRHDVVAVAIAIQRSQADLKALYDDPETFGQFVREAESATADAVREIAEVVKAVARARASWAKATSLWGPLNRAIQNRLVELNESEGRYPDTAPQASVLPFPVQLTADIASVTPRPRGIDRLREAGKVY